MSEEHKIQCPNCASSFDENFSYCPNCGQKNEETVISFKELVSDFLGSLFSFDSKAFKSIPNLIFKPGNLTKSYLNGQRESYLPPFRMYLFFSVVLFLLLPLVVTDNNIVNLSTSDFEDIDADSISSILKESVNKNESLLKIGSNDSSELVTFIQGTKMLSDGYSITEVLDSLHAEEKRSQRFIIRQAYLLNYKKGQGIMGVFLNVLSYSLFFFLPLFALVLKLFYIRRSRLYVEHFIFSLHFFSFLFFMLIFLVLFSLIHVSVPFWIPLILGLLYFFLAIKNVYQQKWFKSFFKGLGILLVNSVLLVPLFLVIAIMLSIIFY